MQAIALVVVSVLLALIPPALAEPPDFAFLGMADATLANLDAFADADADGYGELAWGTSYGMMGLNVLYEATGNVEYLHRQARVVEKLLAKRDSELARARGEAAYVDYQRGRVLKAWGTGHYSGGKHTCWAVHAGMLLFPAIDFVRLVIDGGEKTAPLRAFAEGCLPELEGSVKEFDGDWREGPSEGMGYYVFPGEAILPNNQMNGLGRALFVLGDITGNQEYTGKARKLAAFFKSKLTHVADGDYYVWAYSQGKPDGPPGRGEDVSHAAINAHFMHLAWEYGSVFDNTDMQRLTRTFTRGMHVGEGALADFLGSRAPGKQFTAQAARWAHLARFDPQVEMILREFMAANPGQITAGQTTSAVGFAYILRARKQWRPE